MNNQRPKFSEHISIKFALLLLFSLLLSGINAFSQEKYEALFENDQDQLTAQQQDALVVFYAEKLSTAVHIHLTGHTDDNGKEAYNLALSQRRVLQIQSTLKKLGADTSIISIDFKGEHQPLNQNENEKAKQQNRRVTITWEDAAPVVEEVGDVQELYRLLAQQEQEFCIDPHRDTLLKLDQGTLVLIPANAFNTTAENCISFAAKEVFKYSDMVIENLATTSNGRLLETAGMVYTAAADENGNELFLNTGKELTIMIPTDTLREDMKLFYGERDPHSQQMNWLLANQGPRLSGFDINQCTGLYDEVDCEECRFFFCRFGRIDNVIGGIGNKNTREQNRLFRACQRQLRVERRNNTLVSPLTGMAETIPPCDQRLIEYGVTNLEELKDTLRKIDEARRLAEFEKYGVSTQAAYNDTLAKIREKKLQDTYAEYGVSNAKEYADTLEKIKQLKADNELDQSIENLGEAPDGASNLLYYIAKANQLGWINCDAFSGVTNLLKVNMKTNLENNGGSDCKLIFRDRKSIMLPSSMGQSLGFLRVPIGFSVWILALNYVDGQAYIYLEKSVVSKSEKEIELRPIGIEELKNELRKLDT